MEHVSGKGTGRQLKELYDLYLLHRSPTQLTARKMTEAPPHLRATYNEIHKLIGESAKRIAEFKPSLFIAIGHSEFPPSSR